MTRSCAASPPRSATRKRETRARALPRQRYTLPPARGLKVLLAAAPLEGIDLARDRDAGRDVDP
jgi:hypothetical protein